MECKCESCGAALADDDKFCSECGAKRDQACWSCGASLAADEMFCGECGARVWAPAALENEEAPRLEVRTKKTEVANSTHSLYPDFPEGEFPEGYDEFESEPDPLFEQAIAYVLKSERASISSLQRELQVGYNRSVRIIEDMERAGLVSPMHSNGSRDLLVSWADYTKSNGIDISESGVKSFLGRLFGK